MMMMMIISMMMTMTMRLRNWESSPEKCSKSPSDLEVLRKVVYRVELNSLDYETPKCMDEKRKTGSAVGSVVYAAYSTMLARDLILRV